MAVRTVSVELKMQIADFLRGAGEASAATKLLGHEFEDLGKKSDKFSTSKPSKEMQNFSRVINSSLRDGKTGFDSIKLAIDDTKAHIAGLQRQIRTGSGSDGIFGDLKKAKSDLRTLEGVFKDIGGDSGKQFTQSFSKEASQGIPAALSNPEIAAGVVVAAAALWGPITSILSAAVSAGVGLGVIGAAAAIQRNNPVIVAALKPLEADISSVFKGASDVLVTPFADALHSIDGFVKSEGPEFGRLFGAAAGAVGPIVSGLEHLTAAVLPELTKLTADFSSALADPKVKLALAGAENSIKTMFASFANHPQEIHDGFILIADAVQIATNVVTGFITIGAGLEQVIHPLLTALQVADDLAHGDLKKAFADWKKGSEDAAQGVGVLTDALPPLDGATTATTGLFQGLGTAVTNLSNAITQQLLTAFDNYIDKSLSASNATIAFKNDLANLTTGLKKNGDSFDLNTQKGRDNQSMLNGVIADMKTSYDTNIKNGKGVDASTLAYQLQLNQLKKNLAAQGLTSKQIATLTRQYELLPAQKATLVKAEGTAAAEAAVGGVLGALGKLKNKTVNIHVHAIGVAAAAAAIQGILGAIGAANRSSGNPHVRVNRWGGLYMPAADGLLTHAQVYPPVNPGRFMIAEPQTHGEAFIPKNGDYGRSMNILSAAAGWYGAHVVAGGGGSGGGTTNILVSPAPGMPREFLNLLRFTVQTNGGNVVQALTPR